MSSSDVIVVVGGVVEGGEGDLFQPKEVEAPASPRLFRVVHATLILHFFLQNLKKNTLGSEMPVFEGCLGPYASFFEKQYQQI